MKFGTLIEIVSAIHLTQFITGPYQQRGGLFFVAPPGALKTTAIEIIEEYERSLMISNATVKSLDAMRGDFRAGNIKTLGIADLEFIYSRHSTVSSQIEKILMSLVEEGYRKPGFSDQRIQAPVARCSVVGAMTDTFFESKVAEWLDSGFHRRFIWSRYQLNDPVILTDAIETWKKAELETEYSQFSIPAHRSLPMNLDKNETQEIRHSMRFQRDLKTPLVLAIKIVSVLKWKFRNRNNKQHMYIWNDFSESLSKDGGILNLTLDLKAAAKKMNSQSTKINGTATPLSITQQQIKQHNAMK